MAICSYFGRKRLMTLLERADLVGEVQNHILVEAADFRDRKIGASRAVPTVLEIPISQERSSIGGVGAIVKQRHFPSVPDFIFNVAFSCGDPGLFGRGLYSDPLSIWFNIFFGYYQIDVPAKAWGRPFGYAAARPGADIVVEDIQRIGKSDWNWFSNYMYGVPADVIQPLDELGNVGVEIRRDIPIGKSRWDEVVLDGVDVVSAYVAPGQEHRLGNPHPIFSPVWRAIFGRPHPRDGFATSFMPTRMRAKLYMAFQEVPHDTDLGERAYATLIFGGTVRSDYSDPRENERFLDLQIGAVKHVMERRYPTAGF